MIPLFDFRCEACGNEWEERWPYSDVKNDLPNCPWCDSNFTKRIWTKAPMGDRAKDPYDYLDGPIPDSKPIKSYANDRRKGGKDTT